MKILVTGGAGFIGSAVVRHFIEKTQDCIVNVDCLTYAGDLMSLSSVDKHERYVFEQVNICNRTELDRVFRQYKPHAVMHLAAESHVDRSISGASVFIDTNIVGTYTLLEATRDYWTRMDRLAKSAFRFLHISTDEVYGDLPHPHDAEVGCVLPKFVETSAYAPSNPYSASKAASDHLVRAWKRTYGLPTLITNCSNSYGPYQFPEKLIPRMISNALEGKPLTIYGRGEQIRDWLFVEDHVRALVSVIKHGRVGQTYNIGGSNEKTNLEVVQAICSILDLLAPKETHYAEQITNVQDRPGHDRRYAIDASKIRRELGWAPEQTFETGLKKTVQWYLENRQWGEHSPHW